jgi:L-fuconolactonase
LILAHLGFPNPREDPQLAAHSRIFELAEYPGVYFQVSGMHMFCEYPYNAVWPAIERALETFGPDRMIWGSNYPVLGQDDAYLAEVTRMQDTLGGPIGRADLEAITAGTALKLWFQH